MWSEFVIVSTLILHLNAGVVKAHEPMGGQALGSELAIEALDVAVICRLARPGKVEHHPLMVSPKIQVTRDKFAAIIHTNNRRITDLTSYPFQGLHHILTAITEAGINCWREA